MTHVGQEALHQNWGFEVKPAGLELLAGALCGKQWNLAQLPDLLIWNELGDP
jgi:hypothetical protein